MEHQIPTSNSDHSSNSLDKENAPTSAQHLEVIRTVSRVPGNDHYYEKDGLRTYGDDEDHDHEPPMTMHRFMSLLAMAFLWTGSQIPVYLFGEMRDNSFSQDFVANKRRWNPTIYLRRSRRNRSMGVVCPRKFTRIGSSLPIRRGSVGFDGPTICCHGWC